MGLKREDKKFEYVPMTINKEDGKKENMVLFKSIGVGPNHCLALGQFGTLYTWGDNDCGRMGLFDLKQHEIMDLNRNPMKINIINDIL